MGYHGEDFKTQKPTTTNARIVDFSCEFDTEGKSQNVRCWHARTLTVFWIERMMTRHMEKCEDISYTT